MLLVEQNELASSAIAHPAHVLAAGQIVMTGPARELAGRGFTSANLDA